MTPEERHAQVLAECERLVTRNGALEGLLSLERASHAALKVAVRAAYAVMGAPNG